jgi:prepilin peptidase CpaA
MSYSIAPLILATGLLLLAAGWDIARRRIPNWVNAALGLSGLCAQLLFHGGTSLAGGLLAGFIVLVLLWTPWTRGRLGGGDVKATLAAAIWVGLRELPAFLLVAAVSVGLLALVSYALSSRVARQEMRSNLALAAMRAMPDAPLRSGGGRVSVPFGAGAAAAALMMLWWL